MNVKSTKKISKKCDGHSIHFKTMKIKPLSRCVNKTPSNSDNPLVKSKHNLLNSVPHHDTLYDASVTPGLSLPRAFKIAKKI